MDAVVAPGGADGYWSGRRENSEDGFVETVIESDRLQNLPMPMRG